ncbi:Retrovirus-related Pol polyprotein, partial [Mucuna pruriens]
MLDETLGKGSTLILEQLFLMTTRTKIDVHVGTLSMEFGDTLVQFNIFEVVKHPTEDHSLFGIDLIDELVEEHFQLDPDNDDISNFARDIDIFDCLGSIIDEVDCDELWEVHNLSDFEDDIINLADLSQETELLDLLDQVYKSKDSECSNNNFNGGGSLTNKTTKKKAKSDHPRRGQERIPKKSEMTVLKNQHDELVPMWIQNSWRVTCKDHFCLPFIDQVLEKLLGKSHYCFLDGFSRYMQIYIAPKDQHKTTFTCPFGTFAYTRMSFGLCNVLSTFQHCMTSIFSDLLQDCMEVFMDDFMMYTDSFDAYLENLSKVLTRCIDTNLVLNFEKCHFMGTKGIVLGHLVSNKGIKVDKSKIYIITSLPNPTSVREDVEFKFDQLCVEAFQELKTRLTSAPILQAPNWDYPFELMCDASNSTLGAILGQRAGANKQVHELLEIVFALDKFRSYLLGSKIIIFSNHAALRFLLKNADAKP